ncbi:tyrosine-type recombinase/integrase [Ohessyouella blattaphilus]|uniref:Site-specific integrase n=1 Tax=Ohessyouella blattaphilus TaxID=2949333 RepID=A0ABT1EHZ5_9FIRM|nr:site-specific integrase [Ohessyouella blattaphilus]MCP1110319.1 site-specific integrase [Ohessyouella blattaphilus]MCR8563713.1 site-specific integrase [Ohessyouella blattaphilus]
MAVDKRNRKLPKGIRQRYDGFEGRFMYKGASYLVHGDTITATQKEMTELKYKLEHGIFVEQRKVTLEAWFDTWIREYKENRVKAGTIRTYKDCFYIIKDRIGKQYLTDIRGEHIQKVYNDLLKEGYSISTIKLVSALLSGLIKQALRNGLIERNPVLLAELPREVEKKERRVMTKAEQELFMKYAKDSYLYNLFALMLRTGIRGGEARGLKYSDIDKKKRVLKIQRTLKVAEKGSKEKYCEDTPKTKTSQRDIPLTGEILEILEAQRKFWNFRVEKIDRYLFCTEKGEALNVRRMQSEIDVIIKRMRADKIEFERITPHVFRHTFATRAIEAGMQPQVLKTILGHSTLAMTMDLYSHVLPDTKANEMEKIAGAF